MFDKFDLIKKLLQETDANIRYVDKYGRTALKWLDWRRDEEEKCRLDEIRPLLQFRHVDEERLDENLSNFRIFYEEEKSPLLRERDELCPNIW